MVACAISSGPARLESPSTRPPSRSAVTKVFKKGAPGAMVKTRFSTRVFQMFRANASIHHAACGSRLQGFRGLSPACGFAERKRGVEQAWAEPAGLHADLVLVAAGENGLSDREFGDDKWRPVVSPKLDLRMLQCSDKLPHRSSTPWRLAWRIRPARPWFCKEAARLAPTSSARRGGFTRMKRSHPM